MADNIKNTIDEALTNLQDRFDKIFKSATQTFANDVVDTIIEFDEKTAEVLKKLGRGRELSLQIKEAFAEATPEVIRLGGSLSDVQKIQISIADQLNRNVVVQGEAYAKLFAASKATAQDIGTLTDRFTNAGYSFMRISGEVEKISKFSRSIGVNTEAVTRQMLNNMEEMNRVNFVDGIDGMTRMAAKAASLRIDMQTTLQFAEKIYDPEGAIQMANAFQRLGAATGALLDPLRMMDLAANDPEELQKQLIDMTQQFVRFNEDQKKFEILPGAKRQLREIANEIGIPYKELTKMALGGADLQKKLSEISFPDFVMNEDQKEFIANMAQMNERGEYTVKVKEEQDGVMMEVNKNISQLTKTQLDELQRQQEEVTGKTIEELTIEQMGYIEAITRDVQSLVYKPQAAVASSTTVEDMQKNFLKLTGILSAPTREKPTTTTPRTAEINVGELRRIYDKSVDFGINLFKGLADPTHDFSDAIKSGTEALNVYNRAFKNYGERYMEGIERQSKKAYPETKSESSIESLFRKFLETQSNEPPKFNMPDMDKMRQDLQSISGATGARLDILPNNQNSLQGTALVDFMANATSKQTVTTTNENKNISGEIVVNVKIDAPTGMDTAMLNKAVRDTNFLQNLKIGLDKVASNYNTTNQYNSPPLMIGART